MSSSISVIACDNVLDGVFVIIYSYFPSLAEFPYRGLSCVHPLPTHPYSSSAGHDTG